ncbi:MAG: DUF1203 domain-containing protein [Candidatus Eremiobacteraeota bacterium]|nr:DUF1203 domain-containing protein [Candidatus Eremiobacteraeota bacterium]
MLGLEPTTFQPLFGMPTEALAARGIVRVRADAAAGFPDRIEMRDLEVGEVALLVNYEHLPGSSPYRSRHAIFVRDGATQTYRSVNEVPAVMRTRLLSLRGFDAGDMMIEADVVDGGVVEAAIARFFENTDVAYIHAHNAKRGCYAGRIDRV